MKLKLKEKISLATKVLLVALISLSVIQLNQIKDIHATSLLPEATTRVSVLASGANIEELGASDIHSITIGGSVGFCLDHGKSLRSNDDFARTSTKVSGQVAQVVNWYNGEKGNMDESQCRGIAQAIIWAIQEGKTSNDQLASIIEDVIIYYTSGGATGFGDLFRDWYYYGDANHTGIKDYPTTTTYYSWSYGASSRQRIVATNNTPPDITYPEIRYGTVSSTKDYSKIESIGVRVNKNDTETANKLSGINFDFYKDGTKGGSATTDINGIAEHTFTTEFSKSATVSKDYCSNYSTLSLENQSLVTGYTSKSSAQAAADKEALDKAKELAEAGSGQEHTYKVIETVTKTNYWLNPATSTYEKNFTGSGTVNFDITNKRQQGSVTITKRDSETDNLVDNAIYGLYARSLIIHPDGTTGTLFNKDQLVATFPATIANGTSKLSGLYLGQYYVKEITAPNGYLHSSEVYNVDLNYAGQNVEITDASTTVKDIVQRAKVTSIKKDKELDNGSKDPNIFDFNKDESQGDATRTGAIYGLYAREDINHPDGTGVVTYNQIVDSIHELKSVKGTELSVKNVQATAGTLLATIKTDSNAEFGFEHLYNGKYYIKEITPSEGYTLDPTEYNVDLSYTNQNEQVVIKTNKVLEQVKKQAFDLFKAGHVPGTSTNAKPLAGVEFTVWLESDIQSFVAKGKTLTEAKALAPVYDKLVTANDGTASSIELPFGKYRVAETKAAIDYATADDFFVTVTEDSRTHQSYTNNVIVDEKFTGLIQAIKLDKETGKQVKLEGTEFKIKNTDKDEYVGYWEWLPFPHYVDSWTTNSDGYVRLQEKFEAGNYQLEEIHAPDGYVLDTTPVTFKMTNDQMYEIAEDGKTPIIKAYKSDVSVKGKITIEKQGEVLTDYKDSQFVYELKNLKDAEYDIFAEKDILDPSNDKTVLYVKDELVTSIKTGEDGKGISKELPLGEYYSKEKKAPNGYILSDEIKHFKLELENETVPIVYDNTIYVNERQKVKVEASKQDEDIKEYLANAEISLYANRDVYNYAGDIIVEAGTLLETVITDENGKATFNVDLPNDITPEYATMPIVSDVPDNTKLIGDPNSLFVVKETKAPSNYYLESVNYYVDTKYTNENENELIFKAEFNDIKKTYFYKVDSITDEVIANAKMQVIDQDSKKVVYEFISSKEGNILENLEKGKTYILHEVEQPEGYYLNTEDITFTFRKDFVIKFKNNPILTDIVANKLDSQTMLPVLSEDFEFTIYSDEACTNIVSTVHADITTGKATFKDVRYGTWYIRETKAPKGYKLSDEVKKVVVDDSLEGVGDMYSFIYLNTLMPTTIITTGDITVLSSLIILTVSSIAGIYLSRKKKKEMTSE